MAKTDLVSNPLIPFVLVAGVLSGSLLRTSPPAETGKPGDARTTADKIDTATPLRPWFSDLRPVMDTMDAALGASGDEVSNSRAGDAAGVVLFADRTARDRQILEAMRALRTGLDKLAVQPRAEGCGATTALDHPAQVLAASTLTSDGSVGKARADAAAELLEEYREWRLFTDLAGRVQGSADPPGYRVEFMVATVPDYVDSNSGWLADQGLAAVQSGMAQERYVFDRVKLVDWSRVSASPGAVVPGSRLHERQPGALIFRRVERSTIVLQVVLLVLETPTAGVHPIALRNSLSFLRAWNVCTNAHAPLRVLGPSFSGSTVSLASIIGEPVVRASFADRVVITGSATADENARIMAVFGEGAIFRSTVQTTRVLKERMGDYLESLNAKWARGEHVALLNESNTAYGGDANGSIGGTTSSTARPPCANGHADVSTTESPRFGCAKVFNFPLHVAQLRSDAPDLGQPAAGLLTGPVIPLNMRELTPPTDLIPALRPQLTSPVVESTVDSILDAIRHEKISAVGIFATDDRDVLFLAREVKRAVPDVQLFLFGAHGLYLHPDYLPYLRGALVASSYALTLANQPEIKGTYDVLHRQPFPSMSAEGVFYATRALVSVQPRADPARALDVPYCSDTPGPGCVPVAPTSINVIGEDGYWTLPNIRTPARVDRPAGSPERPVVDPTPGAVPPPPELNVAALPGLPLQFGIGALLALLFVAAHVGVMVTIAPPPPDSGAAHPLQDWPFVRVLVPPRTFDKAASFHRLAVTICFWLLALAASWVVAVTVPFLLPTELPDEGFSAFAAGWLVRALIPVAVITTFLGVIYAGHNFYGPRRRLPAPATKKLPIRNDPPGSDPATRKAGPVDSPAPLVAAIRAIAVRFWNQTLAEQIGWLLFAGMVATMGALALMVFWAVAGSLGCDFAGPVICSGGRLTLARIAGGGIVSPAALTICLTAAFYVALLTGVRRLSLVGFGYVRLARRSAAFELFTAERQAEVGPPAPGSFAALLDMPAQNMPFVYPMVVLLGLLLAVLTTRHVTTVDGRTFALFVTVGTWTTLGLGLLQLTQGLAVWNTARSHLKRLAHTPVEGHLQDIAQHVPWDISLAPPRLSELMPVARMADRVMRDFRSLAFSGHYGWTDVEMRGNCDDLRLLAPESEARLGLRPGDLDQSDALFVEPSHVVHLDAEMKGQEHAAIIQSESWFHLWQLGDSLVRMLQRARWARSTTASPAFTARREVAVAEIAAVPGIPLTAKMVAELALTGPPTVSDEQRSNTDSRDGWFKRCEQLVALQLAFVVRDIVARTITSLFAAMVCLTLLTASHLFYTFDGRAALLSADMIAIAAVALSSVWILIDMERDHVLSRLRTTTPGRVDVNWEFIKRLAVYGVLPLLAVIAALFPEVGGTLFGWLEPLRKLWAF